MTLVTERRIRRGKLVRMLGQKLPAVLTIARGPFSWRSLMLLGSCESKALRNEVTREKRTERRTRPISACAGLRRYGKKDGCRFVADVVTALRDAMQAGYVVLGGRNPKRLEQARFEDLQHHKQSRDVSSSGRSWSMSYDDCHHVGRRETRGRSTSYPGIAHRT
jgi:hypothetical protein